MTSIARPYVHIFPETPHHLCETSTMSLLRLINPTRRRVHALPALALALLLASGVGCVDQESLTRIEPARPTAITISPPSATLSSLGETVAFRAGISDQNGQSYPGTATWSSSDPEIFTVASDGVATAVANGTGTLTATYEGITGTATVEVAQAPAAITVASGGGQEGLPTQPLADPVVVRVEDDGGSPIEGVAVTFNPTEGSGQTDPRNGVTDVDGLAATSWTLGPNPGVQSLTALVSENVAIEVKAAAGEIDPASDTAVYRVVFNATWSATTHPTDYPPGAHFSPLIGAIHNDGATFWALGEIATPGIEQMAETGGTTLLTGEIRNQMPDRAHAVLNGRGIGSPGSTTIQTVVATQEFPLVTLVTMIAPSPDWFVGVDGLSLRDEFGQWLNELEVVLYPLDSGTDDGATYRSPNADSSPKQPIASLKGVSPFSDQPIGTYTFSRVDR